MTTDNTNTTRNDSLAARTDTWLQSFLVWSPGQRDIIKTVALVLMVLDHINLIFQLKQEWMFLAGRGAFSAVCPGVGAESVPSCAYPATGH